MTPQEFKAWFDGFTEALDGIPTKGQWARIKERVGEIDGRPVTQQVFVDRWYPHYSSIGTYLCGISNMQAVASAGNMGMLMNANTMSAAPNAARSVAQFDSYSAMNGLGRAEVAELIG